MPRMRNCPYCGQELHRGPTLGGRTTFLWCLDCMRHWTLDGFEILEPAGFWAGEDGLRWLRRWVDSKAVECCSDSQWRHWFSTEWLKFHPDG